jgi:hypothetical protein
VRSFKAYHLFPSVSETLYLYFKTQSNQNGAIPIFAANWDAYALAKYLTEMFLPEIVTVTYDPTNVTFIFSPWIYFYPKSTCQKILGIVPGFEGTISRSQVPINLAPPAFITVESSFSIQTTPATSILAKIPINVGYGDLIEYEGSSTDFAGVCGDLNCLQSIRIRLVDDNGVPLIPNFDAIYQGDGSSLLDINKYYYPPWEIVLYMEIEKGSDFIALENNYGGQK